jgi:AraC family transcriptional regulator of adaptative response/methylated-DNA-[protein]-cysteine methyltransferase
MLRINRAYAGIEAGESVTSAAFGSGYESLSGFTDRFQAYFGTAPGQSKDKTVIHLVRFTTPVGPMVACATAQGVCLCEFTDRKMLETEFKQLQKLLNAVILPGPNPHLDLLQSQLTEYFAGQRQTFSVPLHTPGTSFQQLVWQALQQIPCGQTRSYGQQARLLGRPEAVRAVASANGSNRVAILIPCHRVIGENGNLTGYGGGLARKKWLLDLEQKHVAPELPIGPITHPA